MHALYIHGVCIGDNYRIFAVRSPMVTIQILYIYIYVLYINIRFSCEDLASLAGPCAQL